MIVFLKEKKLQEIRSELPCYRLFPCILDSLITDVCPSDLQDNIHASSNQKSTDGY